MSDVAASESKWIETNLVGKIKKSLGKECESVRCDVTFPKDCFFLSHVCFVDLYFGDDGKIDEENILKLVVKKPPLDSVLAARLKMNEHFHNEILFYTKFARDNSRYPRCIYANENILDDTVVVMENISSQGYEICPEKYDIPVDYVFTAIEEIARLHAIAYVTKEQKPEKFYDLITNIKDPRFEDNKLFGDYLNAVATRPIDWLRRHCDKNFCDRMEKLLGNGFNDIMLDSVKPVEPLATLCHGDFTRNNIFFRKINGKLEAKLFDFSLITYSSPAIDLSTFLYLNCSTNDRSGKFDEIYHAYHDTLINHLRDSGIDDLDKYSYDKMLSDYKKRAAFGYMVAVFFQPVLRGIVHVEFDKFFHDPIANVRKNRESGGEAMTEFFGKMILELRDFGCLDHLLQRDCTNSS